MERTITSTVSDNPDLMLVRCVNDSNHTDHMLISVCSVMSVPATVIYFIGYDHLRDTIWKKCNNKSLEVYVPLAAGTIARTAAATVISPIELLRTRMQSAEGTNGIVGVLNGINKMVRSDGLSSLWRGLGPTLWRDVPFSAIYWTGYESIKKNLMKRHDNRLLIHNLGDIEISFISGAISGMVCKIYRCNWQFNLAQVHRVYHYLTLIYM